MTEALRLAREIERRPNTTYPGSDIVWVLCPLCGGTHIHGANPNSEARESHRVSHCGRSPGYLIREVPDAR